MKSLAIYVALIADDPQRGNWTCVAAGHVQEAVREAALASSQSSHLVVVSARDAAHLYGFYWDTFSPAENYRWLSDVIPSRIAVQQALVKHHRLTYKAAAYLMHITMGCCWSHVNACRNSKVTAWEQRPRTERDAAIAEAAKLIEKKPKEIRND